MHDWDLFFHTDHIFIFVEVKLLDFPFPPWPLLQLCERSSYRFDKKIFCLLDLDLGSLIRYSKFFFFFVNFFMLRRVCFLYPKLMHAKNLNPTRLISSTNEPSLYQLEWRKTEARNRNLFYLFINHLTNGVLFYSPFIMKIALTYKITYMGNLEIFCHILS